MKIGLFALDNADTKADGVFADLGYLTNVADLAFVAGSVGGRAEGTLDLRLAAVQRLERGRAHDERIVLVVVEAVSVGRLLLRRRQHFSDLRRHIRLRACKNSKRVRGVIKII